MFPINFNDPYLKEDGSIVPVSEVIGGGGGGGGSFTPDYENEILVIGEHGNWKYYIPMNKEYVGPGAHGYEIETDPQSSSSTAIVNLYDIVYVNGEILYKKLIKKLIHNADKNYEDENISITYTGSVWQITCKVTMYNENGTAYTSPVTWTYSTNVDYLMFNKNPTT